MNKLYTFILTIIVSLTWLYIQEVELFTGKSFRFDNKDNLGDCHRVAVPSFEVFKGLRIGSTVLVNDGKIRLIVKAVEENFVDTEVVVGGIVSDRKGINIPDQVLPLSALSKKDTSDLEFVCDLGIEWLGLSFVQRAKEIRWGYSSSQPHKEQSAASRTLILDTGEEYVIRAGSTKDADILNADMGLNSHYILFWNDEHPNEFQIQTIIDWTSTDFPQDSVVIGIIKGGQNNQENATGTDVATIHDFATNKIFSQRD